MEHRYTLPAVSLALTALFGSLTLPTAGAAPPDGAQVGAWQTWVLSRASDIAVLAPPKDDSDQTKAELAELRQLQTERSLIANTGIQYYNAVPATQRWHEEVLALAALEKVNGNRQ